MPLEGRALMLAAASQMSAGSQALALVILLANGANQLIEWGMLDIVGRGEELVAGIAPVIVPVVLAFLAVALLLGAAVSFVLNLVRYAGYRVERYADRVVVEHGLLSRSSRTLVTERSAGGHSPAHRICGGSRRRGGRRWRGGRRACG